MLRDSFEKYWFLYLTSALLWIKTYIVQKFWFSLPVESLFQEFILLISPISSVIVIMWLGLLFFKKRTNASMLTISFLSSSLLFMNVVFYRFFNDFITVPVLFQTSNMGALGGSAFGLLKGYDILIFMDFLILAFVFVRWKLPQVSLTKKRMKAVLICGVVVFIVNLGLAEIVRPQLLTRTFDRGILVKSIGTYNYHLYDLFVNSKTRAQKAFATSNGFEDAEKYVNLEKPFEAPVKHSDLFGSAKGKNIIIVSMESTQNFVINNSVYGQEITPFLNQFIQESYYFDNFFHQTGQGKTSDAEFMVDNSLYPLPSGAVYFTHSQNEYKATPKILRPFGYYSAVFHANIKTFWNRDIMYQNLGYDRFFSSTDYIINEENSVGWGLKDIPFIEQTIPLMKSLQQPFYSRLLTLTNHHPFSLDTEDEMIPEFGSEDGTVNRYFTTVRYQDEAIKLFINGLKAAGLYDNSIIILYGDHYGISANHDKAMSEYLGKEITPYEHIQLQKVPFIIHIPGKEGKRISRAAGQIDIKPTLLGLLGIEGENEMDFGHDLFVDNKEPLIVLRDGSFITTDHVYTAETCYRNDGGIEVDLANCTPYIEKAENELNYSDKIIYGDLMRFSEDTEGVQEVEESKVEANVDQGQIEKETGQPKEFSDY